MKIIQGVPSGEVRYILGLCTQPALRSVVEKRRASHKENVRPSQRSSKMPWQLAPSLRQEDCADASLKNVTLCLHDWPLILVHVIPEVGWITLRQANCLGENASGGKRKWFHMELVTRYTSSVETIKAIRKFENDTCAHHHKKLWMC